MPTQSTDIDANSESARIVSALVCHSHVEMAIKCLGSLVAHVSNISGIRIHDDGSLSADDMSRLLGSIDMVEIVTRQEADARLAPLLAEFPAVAKVRNTFPLMLKLIDGPLLANQAVYAFSDSDVYFHRPIANPFTLPAITGYHAIFMQDRAPSYSIRSWQYLRQRQFRLPSMANTGMVVFRTSKFELERIERLFRWPAFHTIEGMREQTAWGALGMAVGCRLWDSQYVRIMREGESVSGLAVGHYTARTRHLLADLAVPNKNCVRQPDHIIDHIAAGELTVRDLSAYECERGLRRLVGQMSAKKRH